MAGSGKTFPWLGATIVAAIGVVGVVALVDLGGPGETGEGIYPQGDGGQIGLTAIGAGEEALRSQPGAELSLNDPTPLFLPLSMNSGKVDPRMTTERSPGTSFEAFPSKLVFPEEDNRLAVPDVVQVQSRALDVMESLAPDVNLGELARADTRARAMSPRAAIIEVHRVADGALAYRQEIKRESAGRLALVPMETLVVVNDAGMLTERGTLNVVAGGGTLPLFGQQQVDLDEAAKLLKSVDLGAHLTRGIYRISLGP